MILFVSVAVLFIFALLIPEIAYFSSASARDAEIQSIKSVTDVGLLQQKAVMYVSDDYAAGDTARFLCCIAVVALLLIIIGSVVGLVQFRRIRRHLIDT